ncbi:MAG: hypothetical protein QXO98_02350 [Sulfolobales archaeon]
MRIEDFSALCDLKLRTLKVLSIKEVKKIIESEASEISDVLTLINGYYVVECIYKNIKLEEKLSINTIYNELCKCWVNDLITVISRASVDLIKFVKAYITKYAIPTLIGTIKYVQTGGFERPKPIFKCLDDLSNINDVKDVIMVLRDCKEFDSKVLTEALYGYLNYKLDGIDLGRLEEELNEYYWNSLISECQKLVDSIYLKHALLILRSFHKFDTTLKRKLLLGEDITELSRKYDYSLYKSIVKDLNINSYDYISNAFRYLRISSILKLSPLSYDIILYYLLMKEWETTIISYIIYGFTNNLEPTYVKDSLKFLVDMIWQ